MARVLITYHSQTGNTARMAEAIAAGVAEAAGSEAVLKKAFDTLAADIRACDAVVFCSPEYFGYMSGAIKDLFDRTYEELRDDPRSVKKPCCIVVSAGNDGTGALNAIERIALGYKFKKVYAPVISKGRVTEEILARCRELGATLAGGCQMGIY